MKSCLNHALTESETLLETLRCPRCRSSLATADKGSVCRCSITYPIIDGIPRLLLPSMRDALAG